MMSNRSEPQQSSATQLGSFEVRNTAKGFTTWLLTFIAFTSLVEILARFFQEQTSWLVLLGLYFTAVLFHARLFILMHDCGHNRLTASHRLNTWIGHFCAFTYIMPFLYWRDLHNQHHRYQGNLDQRDQHFDLWTMTLEEYKSASNPKKLFYRIYRSPIGLFLIGPVLFFIFFLRWPAGKKSRASIQNILLLNLIILALTVASLLSMEIRLRLMTFLCIAVFNFIAAIWLFYQQHVFVDTYWERDSQFNNEELSFQGSSFIDFPNWMKWFMASIGYHHIHHFNTKIPYYHLKSARQYLIDQNILKQEKKLGFVEMLENTRLKLWDEKAKKLIRFPS